MKTNITRDYLESLNHDITEVRILRKEPYMSNRYVGKIISGYYNPEHYDKLISDIQPFNENKETKCIWTTLQSANTALHARAANRLQLNAKTTTEDSNIDAFTVFPIDIDAGNPAETSASDTEKAETAIIATEVSEKLTELGLPHVKADSGNGWHILIYLSEPWPCSEENNLRFYNAGKVLVDLYGTDIKNYNPARCWKLYGTTVRKGDNTEERPHRDSEIWLPEEIERVPFQEIETRLIEIAPEPEEKPKQKKRSKPSARTGKKLPSLDSRQDLENLARDCGAILQSEWKVKGDYELARTFCPLCNRDDVGKLTYGSGGECGYSCQTNTCQGKNFQDLYESAGYSKSEYQPPPIRNEQHAPTDFMDADDAPPTFSIIDTSKEKKTVPVFPEELKEVWPFQAYIKAYEGKTEVCPAFHFAALMTGITALLGRRIYIKAITPFFPNFFTCICGQTGASRKSTALSLAGRLIEEVAEDVLQLEGLSTPEGLVRAFSLPHKQVHGESLNQSYNPNDQPVGVDRYIGGDVELLETMLLNSEHNWEGFRGFAVIDELAGLLKKAKKGGSEGLLQRLGEFYDNKRRIRNPGSTSPTRAYNPSLSLAGATTMEWLEEELKPDDIRGGLGRRLAFFADEGEVVDIPFTEPGDEELLKTVIKTLKALRTEMYAKPTGFEYTDEAREFQIEWYHDFRKKLRAEENTMLKAAGQGIDVHFKKASLLFASLNTVDEKNNIHLAHVENAKRLTDYLKECHMHILTNFASSEQEKLDRLVLEEIQETPWQTARELYRRLNISSQEMQRILEALLRMGVIGIDKSGKRVTYAAIEKD